MEDFESKKFIFSWLRSKNELLSICLINDIKSLYMCQKIDSNNSSTDLIVFTAIVCLNFYTKKSC